MASESSQPSDKEIDIYGSMLAADNFVNSVLGASLLVVQIVLVLYGVSGFFATPKDRRKGRLRFIVISALMVMLCAVDICLDLWVNFLLLYNGGPDGVSYLQAYSILIENWRWWAVGKTFFFAAIALGEFLMASPLWRCLVLWMDRKWVVLFPFFACLGAIGESLVGDVTFNIGLRNQVMLAGAVLRVAGNIMITFLIVFRVMRARSCTAKAFPNQEPPRWYSEVTALVIESAAPLAIIGICYIGLYAPFCHNRQDGSKQGTLNIAGDVVGCFYDAFCTLSPQMIIVRVTRGKAWNSVADATDKGEDVSHPIQFAHSEKETTTLNISASV
ncbi:hypothetical protein BKA70DRAFT_1104436 [Coprinopsis sp. MPI-PUGE-AT-0042]|nr:hypothetical protein BKA70DRAFT_1104436 [Coprinopsis sp. MPI-PUGE-AT-0042]